MIKREYKKVKVSDLIAYKKNNKKHGENIKNIVDSIQKNSYIAPICVDENMVILAWHGRAKALEELDQEEVEILVVSWLSERQKKDYRLRDNKTTELSERDIENIKEELEELDDPELFDLFKGMEEAEIDFDDIKSNEDRESEGKEQIVSCPECWHDFTL